MRLQQVSWLCVVVLLLLLSGCRSVQAPANVETGAAQTQLAESHKAGDTWTNPKDGAVYVYVPAGPFLMGAADDDTVATSGEKPQATIETGGYWIMQTELTNAQYKRCVEEQACEPLSTSQWQDPQYADFPVALTWFQANDYAHWAGGRLPTEPEWEKACRGTDGRLFPWGNEEPADDLANLMAPGDLVAVGSFPGDASPYGALDMAGNANEWISSRRMDYPYVADDGREDVIGNEYRGFRGGMYLDLPQDARCTTRAASHPGKVTSTTGARVLVGHLY